MSNMEMLDEAVAVTATMDSLGQFVPQRLEWRDRTFTLVNVGRQWDEASGRFVLTEATDGTRFELQLRREDLTWRVRKIWWGMTMV